MLTTEQVIEQFASVAYSDAYYESYVIQFNDWLERVKAEVWREGARDMMEAIADDHGTLAFIAPFNPYERPTKSARDVIAESGGTTPIVQGWA